MNSSAYQVSVLTALYLGSTTTVFKRTVIAALHIFLHNFQEPNNEDNETTRQAGQSQAANVISRITAPQQLWQAHSGHRNLSGQ